MNDLPLNALRVFAVVCRQGGVRPAARELGIAHSSVSRHLAELEAWLGVPLVERGGSPQAWSPTAQAASLARAVQSSLQDMAQAVASVRERRSPFSVTLATTSSVAMRWLLPRLPQLERSHPRIELSVHINQRLDILADAGADLALRMGTGPWPQTACEPLMDDALYPVMSPALWEHSDRPSEPQQLLQLKLLHDRDPSAGWDLWRNTFGPPAGAWDRGPRFTSSDLLLRAAEQGQGVALARHRLAADMVAAGTLVRPFGDREVTLPDAYWIVQSALPETPRHAVSTVVRWLKEQARR